MAGDEGQSGERGVGQARSAIGADLIIPGLAVALTGYYIVSTMPLTWEARSTGWLIGFVLLALCAIQLGRIAVLRLHGEATLGLGDLVANTVENRERLGLLAVLTLFVAALPLTGTTLGLFLVMAASMAIMGVRRPSQIIGIAACTAGSVFLLFFLLLKSRLPQGAIDNALVISAFSERSYVFDMGLSLFFGVIGYIARKTNYEVTAILVGVLLGPLFETYLLRSLRVGQGDPMILFSSPIGNVIWLLALASLCLPFIRSRRRGGVLAQSAAAGN